MRPTPADPLYTQEERREFLGHYLKHVYENYLTSSDIATKFAHCTSYEQFYDEVIEGLELECLYGGLQY